MNVGANGISLYSLVVLKRYNLKRALITDRVHERLITGLEALDYDVDYRPDITLSEVHNCIASYHGIVINSKVKMYRELIDKSTALNWIGRLGSGLEIIDIPYAESRGIAVMNSPEGNRNAVAEHCLGMLLALCNNMLRADREVRSFDWNREANRGMELEGKTIGIIGYGQMGSAFTSKLSSWTLDIIVYDKYKQLSFKDHRNITAVSEDEVWSKADIISVHLPYNDETHHLINKANIDQCKDGVIIINSSRGAIANTKDVVEALESRKLGGACLDVFENEKPNTYTEQENKLYSRLYAMEHVILSPHIAGWTKESLFKIADTIVNKVDVLQRTRSLH